MSTFESDRYRWRETYFVLFDSAQRPTMEKVEKALGRLKGQFDLQSPRLDESGEFESVSVLAPGAYAAMDISYLEGEEVLEQAAQLTEELQDQVSTPLERAKLKRLSACDARFDVLHFEEVSDEAGEEEMFDPSALLLVVDALTKLTGGVAVDPQSATSM
jgi:hypothetical protein